MLRVQDQLMAGTSEQELGDAPSTVPADHDHVGILPVGHIVDDRRGPPILHQGAVPNASHFQRLAPLAFEFLLYGSPPLPVELNRKAVLFRKVSRDLDRAD